MRGHSIYHGRRRSRRSGAQLSVWEGASYSVLILDFCVHFMWFSQWPTYHGQALCHCLHPQGYPLEGGLTVPEAVGNDAESVPGIWVLNASRGCTELCIERA